MAALGSRIFSIVTLLHSLRIIMRSHRHLVVSFLAYLALALWTTHTSSAGLLFHSIFTLGDKYYPLFWWKDSTLFIWSYEWWPYAILHGLNPFITDYLWYPIKVNLTHMTSIPSLALVMAPVTLIFGPLFSYNLVQVLTPALNAFCARLLLNEIKAPSFATWMGGLVFGFSPFVIGHLPLHPNLDFVALVPLIPWLFLLYKKNKISHLTFILSMAFTLAAQVGVSLEISAFIALAGIITLIIYAEKITPDDLVILAKSGFLATLFILPFLSYYFFSPDINTTGVPSFEDRGSLLHNIFVATPAQRYHQNRIDWTKLNAPELGMHIGILLPLVLIFCRDMIPKKISLLVVVFLLITLGTPIQWSDASTPFFNPIGLVHRLPLMSHALMIRFSSITWLVIALALTYIFDNGTRLTKAAVITSLIAIAPNPLWGQWIKTSSNITPDHYFAVFPDAFTTLSFHKYAHDKKFIALPCAGLSSAWQAISGMEFKQFCGYTGLLEPQGELGLHTPLMEPIANHGGNPASPEWARQITQTIHKYNFDGILYDPDPWAPRAVEDILVKNGWSVQNFDHLEVLSPPK